MAAEPLRFALMQALQQGHSGILGRIVIIHLEEDPTSVCSCDDYMM